MTAEEYKKTYIRQDQIDPYLPGGRHFIDEAAIHQALQKAAEKGEDPAYVREILAKSLDIQTLTIGELAALMQVRSPELWKEMEQTALAAKHKVYDNRVVMFAPLYLSNLCVNRCAYCGFSDGNAAQRRRVLLPEEMEKEIDVLAGRIGHKRLIAVYGEHPSTGVDYIARSIETIYRHTVKSPGGATVGIRRVNVNAAPMRTEDLATLKRVGIGTFQVFQETYHRETYRRLHPADTVKGNYDWRTTCFHRAMEAGVDDVGLGVLFGLYDWRFECLALLQHARELERAFHIGPHTISFPRMEPASGTDVPTSSPWLFDDETFGHIVTLMRLAVPYTGLIVTCRERPEVRNRAISCGITQMDCSSNIAIGGYHDSAKVSDQRIHNQQFLLADSRSLTEVVGYLATQGIITSFCTAGYRCGRTGGCIMDALKTGKEGKFCKVNAVLTFREWLDDFADEATRTLARPVLEKEIEEIRQTLPKFFPAFKEHYDRIVAGERDLFF